MKADWTSRKVNDFCLVTDFVANGSFASLKENVKYLDDDGYAVLVRLADSTKEWNGRFKYVTEHAYNFLKKSSLRPSDLVMSNVGEPGKVFLVPALDKPMTLGPNSVLIRCDETLSSNTFLFYYFTSNLGRIKIDDISEGVAQKKFNKTAFRNLEIPLPSLPEQQRIVIILNEAFEGMAKATANAKKNLTNARELFESYLQSVFTNKGEGWVERKLGEKILLAMIDGDRGSNYPKASDFQEVGDCLFMNTKNVRPNGFEFETTMFITNEKDSQLRKGKLIRNDIVMTTRGTIGNIGLYSHDVPFDNVRINSGMLIFRVNQSQILPAFLFELFRSHIIKSQIKKHTSGAAQPQLPINTLVNFTIPVPNNLQTQQTIVDNMGKLFAETERLEAIYQQKLTALDELKKSILIRAFSGEL